MSRTHLCSLLTLCLMLGPAWTAEEPPRRTDAFGDPLPDGAVARLGTVRWRATEVFDMTFSRDGKVLATASGDFTARLWDPTDGHEIRKFAGFRGQVWHVALSPDGKALAAVCSDDVLRIWDAATGKLLREIEKPYGGPLGKERFDALVFSADGKSLMSVHGASIRSFDAASGAVIDPPAPPEKAMTIDAVSEDGSTAVSTGKDGELVVWDLATAKILGRAAGRGGKGPIALSPDHRRLAAAWKDDASVIQIWDIETGKKLGRCRGGPGESWSLCFSPDGKFVASGDWGVMARLWEADTGKERWQFCAKFASHNAVDVRFAPDGKSVAAKGWDGMIRLIDADSGKERGDPDEQRAWVVAVTFTADGKRVVMGAGDCSIRLWDAATGKETRRLKGPSTASISSNKLDVVMPGDHIWTLGCSPDGKTLAVGTEAGVLLWDSEAAREPRALEGTSQTTALAFSPDGKWLATGERTLHLWDAAAGKQRPLQAKDFGGIGSLCVSADGRLIAVGCRNDAMRIWDAAAAREVVKFEGNGGDNVYSLYFSPDGKTLASSRESGRVQVWEVVSVKERERLNGDDDRMEHLAMSPDGRFLAFGGTDKVIHIYDLTAGKEVHEFRGHDGWISSLAFSPDGKLLVSGSYDCTALVWDMGVVRPADRPKGADLDAKEQDALWDRLADDDAVAAGRAIRSLLAAPRQAAALLRERLRPDSTPQADLIARLIRDLDADDFDVREQASAHLRELDEAAAPALRKALEGKPSAELQQRARSLLAVLDKGGPTPEALRAARALEVLERLGTPQAEDVLKTLAGGKEKAPLTQDAAAALERLKKRRSVPSTAP